MKIAGEHFSLLETENSLPMQGIDGLKINWGLKIKVNRKKRTAVILGIDNTSRLYVAQINYDATLDGGKASLNLYYSDITMGTPVSDECWDIMDDGRIVFAGGNSLDMKTQPAVQDNFKTTSNVYAFSTQPQITSTYSPWIWLGSGFLIVVGCIILAYRLLSKKSGEEEEKEIAEEAKKSRQELQEQISRLIEEKQLFRKKDIRISDIASELATNRTYISLIVNSSLGTNFSDLINSYRIEYAQKLMIEHPEMSHTEVAEESGFSSRTSFLRTFKSKTGLSPTEWKQSRTV